MRNRGFPVGSMRTDLSTSAPINTCSALRDKVYAQHLKAIISLKEHSALRLTERDGDKYTIEESSTLSLEGRASFHRTALPVKSGTGEVTVDGKPIACTIWTAKGERDGRPTETSCWIPEGRKDPLRMTFKQAGAEGDVSAVSLKETVKIGDRAFTCVKLAGKITTTRGKGTLTIWTSPEIPSAQVRMDIVLTTPEGKVKFNVEPLEIHEEK